MEKEIELGSVGKLDIAFSGAKATFSGQVALPGGLSISMAASEDTLVVLGLIRDAIKKEFPSVAVIDDAAFDVLSGMMKAIS